MMIGYLKHIIVLLAVFSFSLKGQPESLKRKADNELLFLLFEIKKDSLQQITVNLLEQKIVNGKRKKIIQSQYKEYLRIELYEGEELITTEVLQHPLCKHIEYFDEQGKPLAKDVQLADTQFFVRLQTFGNADKVVIIEKRNNTSEKQIATLPLKE